MPPLPGEERVLTIFADIHYYFTAPTPRPLHHRFDKGSYVYIYHDVTQRKTRIEVANNPGTPDQDAFQGGLGQVHLRHSTAFPTLCTLTVDGQTASPQSFPPPPSGDAYEWRLPSQDPRDGSGDLLRLHTLDIYFWTLDDSNQFMEVVESLLSRTQIETDRHSVPSQSDNISSVVQQLENVAVTDPAYQNGQTRNSRSESIQNTAPEVQNVAGAGSFHPPPVGFAPPPTQQTVPTNQALAEQPRESPQFAPLPYNPAAPAAPEPIQHREKTPPPADGADGTGLVAAVAADQGIPYTPPSQMTGAPPSFAPPPSQGYSMPGGYASPPPSAGLTHSGSFSSQSSVQSPPVAAAAAPYSPTFIHGGGYQQFHQPPGMMQFAPPPQDPNAHMYGPALYAPPPHMQQTAPQPPIGGYSNYSYDNAPKRHASISSEYDIHNQLYRPTEAEATSRSQKYAQQAMKNPGQRPRKLEDSAQRMEGSINRFLKKIEKKL